MGVICVLVVLISTAPTAAAATPEERFRQANDLVRGGDGLKGIEGYRALAASGIESSSLYWNWAQASSARGARGEALWALLRAQELEPGDAALTREIEKLREVSSLDPAEIAPEPLAGAGRMSRRFRLGLLALIVGGASVLLHAAARFSTLAGLRRIAWIALGLGLALATLPIAAVFARPAGVVVSGGAPLLDSASPTAGSLSTLREGEVVPLLAESGEYLRVEDSSGARGWARRRDVWPLDAPQPFSNMP